MDGYIAKPIDPDDLYSALDEVAGDAVSLQPTHGRTDSVSLDTAALRRRMLDDHQLIRTLLTVFLADCPPHLVALQEAVAQRDATAIRRVAHALKGAAGNISAPRLFESARLMEEMAAEGRFEHVESCLQQLCTEAAAVFQAAESAIDSAGGGHDGVPSGDSTFQPRVA
jgi:HPt (histidine-containing phosphotransfer) domain-containing protein